MHLRAQGLKTRANSRAILMVELLHDATRGLKTIGCKTNTSCETPLGALKPLVEEAIEK